MQQMILPTDHALGCIARHNISDAHGHKVLAKGRRLDADDIARLLAQGITTLAVVQLDDDDIDEHRAAALVAQAIAGPATSVRPPHHGRADVHAAENGMLVVDTAALAQWHTVDGVTIATRERYTVVDIGQRIATVKILPFALPKHTLDLHTNSVVMVRPFVRKRVAVVLVGAPASMPRLQRQHQQALLRRLHVVAADMVAEYQVPVDVDAVAHALQAAIHEADLVITLSETSIMSRDDVIPQAVVQAHGTVTCYGAPVEPGNLLLLADMQGVPVLGAPGCVRSQSRNVVDLVLPRLVANDIPSAADVYALGHGGLLD